MRKELSVFAAAMVLAGCSSLDLISTPDFDQQREEVEAVRAINKEKSSNIQFVDAAYLSEERIAPVDKRFKGMHVEFESPRAIDLNSVLEGLVDQFGIQYVIADELQGEDMSAEKLQRIKFSGPIYDFFDYLSSAYNVYFDFSDNALIKVYHYKNHVFNLQQYFDGNAYSSSFNIGGGEGAASGMSGKTDIEFKTNSWERIEKFLEDALSDDETFTVFEDYSLVSVKARPEKFLLMDDFFDRLVAESKMQVAVDLRVISFNEDKLNQLAVKLGLTNSGKLGLTTDLVDAIALSSLGGGLTGTDGTTSFRIDAVANELAQSVVHEGHFVSLPNRVIPLNIVTNTKYISSVETTLADNDNPATRSVEVSDLVTGFSMMLLPKILEDGRIQITSGFSRKQLIGMDSADGVTLPTVDENETTSTVTMDSGEVRLVTLFKDNTATDNEGVQIIGAGSEHKTKDRYFAVLVGASSYKNNTLAK